MRGGSRKWGLLELIKLAVMEPLSAPHQKRAGCGPGGCPRGGLGTRASSGGARVTGVLGMTRGYGGFGRDLCAVGELGPRAAQGRLAYVGCECGASTP